MSRWQWGDFKIARKKMVKEQLRDKGITNINVLKIMEELPRHFFVDEALAVQAYNDVPMPIGEGQTLSQPYTVALMTQELNLNKNDRVLEIGFGSGYQTALLSMLAAKVYAVERLEGLFIKGQVNLEKLNISNVRFRLGDGTLGWPEKAPYNAILVAAGGPKIPAPFIEQLTIGGKIIMPVGVGKESQNLILGIKNENGFLDEKIISGCRFVPLVGNHGW